ncbi:MAG: diacylglycerol kinase family lipid kinase [bacterium]|nr:diacylglycerol kinase family lipid kinase [bacterium]
MLLIVNPAAAGGRVGREWAKRERVLKRIGFDCPTVFTEAPRHATEIARNAVHDGEQLIVAAGGDGTLCEAAEGLYLAGGGTLAMLPVGTGNDTARTLEIPTRFETAARTALAGHWREIDLIRVGEHVVVNAIGVGLTGDINRRAAHIKVVRGIAAYAVTAAASLFRYEAPAVHMKAPNYDSKHKMMLLAVHNGPTTGGGFRLTPQAQPDDGMLDVCLVEDIPPFSRMRRLFAGIRGTLGCLPGSHELQAKVVELHHDQPLPAHLDGNQILFEPPMTRFELVPRALRIAAPPSTMTAVPVNPVLEAAGSVGG